MATVMKDSQNAGALTAEFREGTAIPMGGLRLTLASIFDHIGPIISSLYCWTLRTQLSL